MARPPTGLHPNSPKTLHTDPQPAPVLKALPWHQALLLPAHCPPCPTPQGAEAQPAQPYWLAGLTLLRLCTQGLGKRREPEEGEGGVGAGQAGTG